MAGKNIGKNSVLPFDTLMGYSTMKRLTWSAKVERVSRQGLKMIKERTKRFMTDVMAHLDTINGDLGPAQVRQAVRTVCPSLLATMQTLSFGTYTGMCGVKPAPKQYQPGQRSYSHPCELQEHGVQADGTHNIHHLMSRTGFAKYIKHLSNRQQGAIGDLYIACQIYVQSVARRAKYFATQERLVTVKERHINKTFDIDLGGVLDLHLPGENPGVLVIGQGRPPARLPAPVLAIGQGRQPARAPDLAFDFGQFLDADDDYGDNVNLQPQAQLLNIDFKQDRQPARAPDLAFDFGQFLTDDDYGDNVNLQPQAQPLNINDFKQDRQPARAPDLALDFGQFLDADDDYGDNVNLQPQAQPLNINDFKQDRQPARAPDLALDFGQFLDADDDYGDNVYLQPQAQPLNINDFGQPDSTLFPVQQLNIQHGEDDYGFNPPQTQQIQPIDLGSISMQDVEDVIENDHQNANQQDESEDPFVPHLRLLPYGPSDVSVVDVKNSHGETVSSNVPATSRNFPSSNIQNEFKMNSALHSARLMLERTTAKNTARQVQRQMEGKYNSQNRQREANQQALREAKIEEYKRREVRREEERQERLNEEAKREEERQKRLNEEAKRQEEAKREEERQERQNEEAKRQEEAKREEERQERQNEEAKRQEEAKREEERQERQNEEAKRQEEAKREEERQERQNEEAKRQEEAKREEERQERQNEEAKRQEEAKREEERQERQNEEAKRQEEAKREEERQDRLDEEAKGRREDEERHARQEEAKREEERQDRLDEEAKGRREDEERHARQDEQQEILRRQSAYQKDQLKALNEAKVYENKYNKAIYQQRERRRRNQQREQRRSVSTDKPSGWFSGLRSTAGRIRNRMFGTGDIELNDQKRVEKLIEEEDGVDVHVTEYSKLTQGLLDYYNNSCFHGDNPKFRKGSSNYKEDEQVFADNPFLIDHFQNEENKFTKVYVYEAENIIRGMLIISGLKKGQAGTQFQIDRSTDETTEIYSSSDVIQVKWLCSTGYKKELVGQILMEAMMVYMFDEDNRKVIILDMLNMYGEDYAASSRIYKFYQGLGMFPVTKMKIYDSNNNLEINHVEDTFIRSMTGTHIGSREIDGSIPDFPADSSGNKVVRLVFNVST